MHDFFRNILLPLAGCLMCLLGFLILAREPQGIPGRSRIERPLPEYPSGDPVRRYQDK